MRCAGRIRKNPSFKEGDDWATSIDWGKAVMPIENFDQELNQSWVDEITKSPYFLGSDFLLSGRAKPETLRRWRIEDELRKENPGWKSVEKGRASRHKE
jgi:hypothetical protein